MKHLLHFMEHLPMGVAQILGLTLVTIALHFIVQPAQITNNPFVIYGLKGAEYALFIFDMILLTMIFLKSLKNFIKELWKS
jgi:hypothetical protein